MINTLLMNKNGLHTTRQIATPLAQEGAGNGVLCGEDGHRDSPVAGGEVLGAAGNHIVTVQPLVPDALIPQELCQPACCRDRAALAACDIALSQRSVVRAGGTMNQSACC